LGLRRAGLFGAVARGQWQSQLPVRSSESGNCNLSMVCVDVLMNSPGRNTDYFGPILLPGALQRELSAFLDSGLGTRAPSAPATHIYAIASERHAAEPCS
jgi:hypothetical protein